jgi:hypothetical protein
MILACDLRDVPQVSLDRDGYARPGLRSGEKAVHEIRAPALRLVEYPLEVLTDDAERQQLHAAEEENRHHERRIPAHGVSIRRGLVDTARREHRFPLR